MIKKAIYIQYTSPAVYPPLEHSSNILADKGWDILFLGLNSSGQSQSLIFPDHHRIQVRQLPSVSTGWRQKTNYIYFLLWVIFNTIIWRPQWIYASDLFSAPVALLLSIFTNLQIAYHEHDSPNTQSPSAFIRILLVARQQLAKQADICILPNEQRANFFQESLHLKSAPFVVWNCPAQKDFVQANRKQSTANLSLWYHGSIVPDRLPKALLFALAKLPKTVILHVTGYEPISNAGYIDELNQLAEKLEIREQLFFLPAIPQRKNLLIECKKHDVGISFMPHDQNDINMKHMVGASNKAFDYLSCGLALLVSNLPDWEELYVKNEYGLACDPDNPKSIADVLRWFLEHPHERQQMGEKGRLRIKEQWNYETQFAPILEVMTKYSN